MRRDSLCWIGICALLSFSACGEERDERGSEPSSEPASPESSATAEPEVEETGAAESHGEDSSEPGAEREDDGEEEGAGPTSIAPVEDGVAGFAAGDGGGVTDPTRAVRAFFREHAGCDPQCAVADPDAEQTDVYLREPRRLSSTPLADGFAQLWQVGWAMSGPPSGSYLVLVVPDGGLAARDDEEDEDGEDLGSLSDILPAVVAGHRVILAAELEYNEQQSGNDVLVDRRPVRRPEPLRVENGVLRTTFITREESTYFVSWDDCQEIERGPRVHYRREILCVRAGAAAPERGRAAIDAGPGLLCRNVISRRGLNRPGGGEDCNGPNGPARRASADERRPLAVDVVATSPTQLHVESNRGEVPPELLGDRPLADWPGLPSFERLCPILSLPEDCDEEQRARYYREVGLPAP